MSDRDVRRNSDILYPIFHIVYFEVILIVNIKMGIEALTLPTHQTCRRRRLESPTMERR